MKVKSSNGYLDQEKLEHPFIHVLCIVQRDIAAKEVGEEVAEIKMYEASRVLSWPILQFISSYERNASHALIF